MKKTFIFTKGDNTVPINADTEAHAWVALSSIVKNISGYVLTSAQG